MTMNFLYGIPHTWESPRTTWEDVYLLPSNPEFEGPGIHLTVVALLAKLGDQDYVVDTKQADMYIRADDCSKSELLERTRRFIQHIGIDCGKLIEVSPDLFRHRIDHATLVESLVEREAERGRGERGARPLN